MTFFSLFIGWGALLWALLNESCCFCLCDLVSLFQASWISFSWLPVFSKIHLQLVVDLIEPSPLLAFGWLFKWSLLTNLDILSISFHYPDIDYNCLGSTCFPNLFVVYWFLYIKGIKIKNCISFSMWKWKKIFISSCILKSECLRSLISSIHAF